jgi:beta-glucanase (GH16 family)
VEGDGWVSLSVNVNDLVDQGLSLLTVDTGIVIWASDHSSTVFRLDNVRWVANPDGPIVGEANTGGTISDWVKADKNSGYTTPAEYAGYTKIWSEEFDDASINTDNWTFEIGTTDTFGNVGWGNNELQYYREENAYLEDGLLVIEAKKETYSGQAYTSSRMKTMDKFSFQYGRVDIRAAVAEGKGLWSALWMMGQNWSDEGWPYCGELDIIDTIGGPGNEGTVINKAFWNNGGIGSDYDVASHGTEYDLAGGETFSGTFHVFSLIWTENSITWYVDDVESHSLNISTDDLREAFQQEFFLIFNVAVGGDWPGAPVTATNFPRGMLVDYVRVFQPED